MINERQFLNELLPLRGRHFEYCCQWFWQNGQNKTIETNVEGFGVFDADFKGKLEDRLFAREFELDAVLLG